MCVEVKARIADVTDSECVAKGVAIGDHVKLVHNTDVKRGNAKREGEDKAQERAEKQQFSHTVPPHSKKYLMSAAATPASAPTMAPRRASFLPLTGSLP